MATKPKPTRRTRKRKIPLIAIGVTAKIAKDLGLQEAGVQAQGGNWGDVINILGNRNIHNYTNAASLGVMLGLIRGALGPIKLISGKKFDVTLF